MKLEFKRSWVESVNRRRAPVRRHERAGQCGKCFLRSFNHIVVAGAVASLLFVDIMVMEVLLCTL
jgi:hypothetical protein